MGYSSWIIDACAYKSETVHVADWSKVKWLAFDESVTLFSMATIPYVYR